MTTATPSKPATMPAPSPAKVLFQGLIAMDKITVKEQVRKKFDENAAKELAESVRTKGVINPITLRPIGKGYELVAGERRFRAAKAAGLKEIPAVVRELDDQAAALYQVEENVHRKDLTPIEEARGFKLLTQPSKDGKTPAKYSVEQLAQLVDKSMAYVYRALALLDLPVKAIEAIEKGEITPAHGHQLLRAPEGKREEFLEDALEGGFTGPMTVSELRDRIEGDLGRDLAGAKFPKDKPFAGEVACSACPNNSGNQGMLFEGAEKGLCMLRSCFEKKTTQHWKDVVEKLESYGAHVLQSPNHLYEGQYISGRTIGKEITRDQIKSGQVIVLSKGSGKIHATIEKKSKSGRNSNPGQSYDWERDSFIRNAVTDAICKAEAKDILKTKAGRKAYEEAALALLNERGARYFADALGVEKISVSKLTDDQLAAAILWSARRFGWHPKKKQIEAEARKQAQIDYKAKKEKKA